MTVVNIVALSSGTLVSLFPLEAFTPLGGVNEWSIMDATRWRYNFARSPDLSLPREELRQNGLVFDLGALETEAGEISINNLSIHNDGLVIRANTTEHAEQFFNDFITWLVKDYGCRNVASKMLYASDVVVDFEWPAANVINNYHNIANIVLSNINENREADSAAFSGFSIEFVTRSATMPKFTIERRLGSSVEDERYFCSAPLTTERHIQVLEEIEQLFS